MQTTTPDEAVPYAPDERSRATVRNAVLPGCVCSGRRRAARPNGDDMTLSSSNTHRLWRATFALVGAAFAFLWLSTGAWAAGPRPLFQMPVPCGQTWDASTYSDHWTTGGVAHPNAIDLAQRDGLLNNLSEGEPALASAKG